MVWASELSALSDYEFVCLVAHYNTVRRKAKSGISSDLAKRGFRPEQIAAAQKNFEEKFSPVVSCNLRFTKPFGHLRYENFDYIMVLFENYERGCLPFPGSVSEQPAKIIEIFSVLKQLQYEENVKVIETKNGRY